MTTPTVDTLSQKIITAMQPLVREEAKRIVAARADSPEERAARRADADIMAACKRVADAYDMVTAKGITNRSRAAARGTLIAEAGKLERLMIKHGRMPKREAE